MKTIKIGNWIHQDGEWNYFDGANLNGKRLSIKQMYKVGLRLYKNYKKWIEIPFNKSNSND